MKVTEITNDEDGMFKKNNHFKKVSVTIFYMIFFGGVGGSFLTKANFILDRLKIT